MPNPKVGTVTMDIAKAVQEAKAGRIEYRVDKAGIVHAPVGKRSFRAAQLAENVRTLYPRAACASGRRRSRAIYVKSVFIVGHDDAVHPRRPRPLAGGSRRQVAAAPSAVRM